ncbi:MAG: nitroreductase family protein [Thermomicrobiales bacterium]
MSAPRIDPEAFFQALKSRRVCRSFTDQPVSDADLKRITEAARWASSAGNRHIHKFLVVRNPETIRNIRSVAPGMLSEPPAAIVILTDAEAAKRESIQLDLDTANHGDVGTAAMNMLNMAHVLGLGACPVTSFSHSGVAVMLGLPAHLEPEWIIMLGHPAPVERKLGAGAPKPLSARDLTWWDEVGRHDA